MRVGRRLVVNGGVTGQAYYNNRGNPFDTIDRPTDINNVDRLNQPKETAFINKNASGTRATADAGHGVGIVVGRDGKNILWDNLDGEFTGNAGQGVSVVKLTAQVKRHQSGVLSVNGSPYIPITDTPFIQFGGTNKSINGRRLVGSIPQLSKRKMHMTNTSVATVEYELANPRDPFSARVRPGSARTTQTHFLEEATDIMTVARGGNRFQRIPVDRGFTPPRYPINTEKMVGNAVQFDSDAIRTLPYINPMPEMNTQTYIRDIVIHPDFLVMNITATLANDDPGNTGSPTATYTIDWGDGTSQAGIVSGTPAATKTYAAVGIFDIRIINDIDPTDVKVERYLMAPAGWTPTFHVDRNWNVVAAGTPGSKATTIGFDAAWVSTPLTATSGAVYNFAPFIIRGAPFIKIAVDFGDGGLSGSLQNLTGFMPTSHTLTESTFNISHQYKHNGVFNMKVYAERLSNEAADGLPGLTQQRQQIMVLRSVRVSS